jgi:ParB-like chromosome segregation protein Spo0J
MVQKVDIRIVKENKKNPRYIRDNKFKKLVKSIKDFPEMLEYRPIIVDENMTILGGNMRYKAAKAAGLFEIYIDVVKDWTDKQKEQFIIKDNVGFGDWDWDLLANEWDVKDLNDWGLNLPEFEPNNIEINESVEVSNEGDKCPECGRKL